MKVGEFLKTLELVEPALSRKEFIPAFTNFCFYGDFVVGYNDLIGIRMPCETPFKAGVKGARLLSLLSSVRKDEELALAQKSKEDSVEFKAGKTRIKMPFMLPEEFLFTFPDTDGYEAMSLEEEHIEAISKCMLSVSRDTSRPESMGVTVTSKNNTLQFYSTDNVTITWAETTTEQEVIEDGDFIILPYDFCKSLVDMYRELRTPMTLLVAQDRKNVVVEFKESGALFSRLISVKQPHPYEDVIEQQTDPDDITVPIPDDLEEFLKRANILVEGTSTGQCHVKIEDSKLQINTSSEYGTSEDSVELAEEHADVEAYVDPFLINRALEYAQEFTVTPSVVVFYDEGYVHLVSNQTRASGRSDDEEGEEE